MQTIRAYLLVTVTDQHDVIAVRQIHAAIVHRHGLCSTGLSRGKAGGVSWIVVAQYLTLSNDDGNGDKSEYVAGIYLTLPFMHTGGHSRGQRFITDLMSECKTDNVPVKFWTGALSTPKSAATVGTLKLRISINGGW